MSYYKTIALILSALLFAGCASTPIPDPEMTEPVYEDPSANTGSQNPDGMSGGEEFDPSEGELTNVIYFEFDSSDVRAMDTDIVSRHAMQLSGNQRVSVRLEGHADERGSREYNIGLGERRAQAVRRLLLIQGVSASQIATVSFGEERPDDSGSSESAYAKNRRVVINYTN